MAVEHYVYADESGIEDDGYCVVAGFIGAPLEWDAIKEQWKATLQEFNVRQFHGREFFPRERWKSPQSPYHGWTGSKGRDFRNALLSTVAPRDIYPIGGGVDVKAFLALPEKLRRFATGAPIAVPDSKSEYLLATGAPSTPYHLAFNIVVTESLECSAESDIHLVFDRQEQYAPWARLGFNLLKEVDPDRDSDRLKSLTFSGSLEEPALQVADLFSYLFHSRLVEG